MNASANPVAGALAPGTRLLEYRIERVLGTGGFGITYAAYDTHLDKTVAIKEYLPAELAVRQDPNTVSVRSEQSRAAFTWGREQFLKEARVVARFSHPHLIHVYRFFEANETAYFVMEYADGTTLEEMLKRDGQLSEAAIRSVLMPVLEGLREVHRARVLHRDIKPSNIIVRKDGSPVLIDFGSARQNVGTMTRSIMSVVTAGYAPIEQYAQDGHQGPWTDIYATGAVAYRAVAGKRPIDAVSRMRRDPMPLAEVVGAGRYPLHFLRAIDWALRVAPEDRPVGIADWRQALDGTLTPPPAREGASAPITATTWQTLIQQIPDEDQRAAAAGGYDQATQHVQRAPIHEPGGATEIVTLPPPPDEPAEVSAPLQPPEAREGSPPPTPPPALEPAPEVELPPVPAGHQPLFTPPPDVPVVRQAVPRPPPVAGKPVEAPPLVFAASRQITPGSRPRNADGTALADDLLVDPPTQPVITRPAPAARMPWGLVTVLVLLVAGVGYWALNHRDDSASSTTTRLWASHKPAAAASNSSEATPGGADSGTVPVAAGVDVERMNAQSSFRDCSTCPVMMVLPPGSFLMGSPPDPGTSRAEAPAHRVAITHRLAMARDEITVADWDACVAGGGCAASRQAIAGSDDGRLPAIGMSYADASRYAAWLSRATHRHYRLPTEAEWEYAARAGTMTANFWPVVEDDTVCAHANSADRSAKKLLERGARMALCDDHFESRAPVGSFAANGFGLRDMAGNVWEWTLDCWRDSYVGAATDGSALLAPGCTQHVVRGGSWRSTQGALRTAAREARDNAARDDDLGARLVAD